MNQLLIEAKLSQAGKDVLVVLRKKILSKVVFFDLIVSEGTMHF